MNHLKLVDRRDETDRIRILQFTASSGDALPAYTAGTHLDFELDGIGNRSYSLIDWPQHSDQNPPGSEKIQSYTIAVQREDDGDGGSKMMHQLQIGQSINASDPVNDFELIDSVAPVLLLAGGIGITPLISMATSLASQKHPFSLHYAARSLSVMGFHSTLSEHFADHVQFYFDDTRPLDLAALFSEQGESTELYICGPKGMIEAARKAATTAGFADNNIHVELFSSPDTESGDSAFEVEINDSGEVFEIPVGQSIIDVLEAAGKDLMFDCQRGDCGICQTDVISGIPDHRDVVLSEADRASGKVMQICVSRAKSPRLVLDL